MSSSLLQCLDELIHRFDDQSVTDNTKQTPYQIYAALGSPKHILAPMVLQSELAFRMLCRKHGTTLCYSPMLTSAVLIADYEADGNLNKHIITCKQDRPLVVQLCADNVDELIRAAQIIENNIECDAIDLNLGCPQERAQQFGFGAFLLDKPQLVSSMIRGLVQHCKLPIFAKIRLLPTAEQTLEFVRMLQESGVSLIAVHGRQIMVKNKGSADLDMIRRIKAECNVPIVCNGNVASFDDIAKNLELTKCDAVMSAVAIRINPYLFSGDSELIDAHPIDRAWEYLECVEKYGVVDTESINKHILWFCYDYLQDFSFEHGLQCEKKRRQIGLIRKLLRWPKLCKTMIQFKSVLDLLERIVDKQPFRHPAIKIFSIEQIKKKPGYILYWHKHNKKSTRRSIDSPIQCNSQLVDTSSSTSLCDNL